MSISAQQRALVVQRAGNCCEYCRLPQSGGTATFHVDHIIPHKHNGSDDSANLCLACLHCNGHKGADISGFDPETGELTRLYHPRFQAWGDHFRLRSDATISGQTPEGRVTAQLLRFNDIRRVEWRQTLIEDDSYPCTPDA